MAGAAGGGPHPVPDPPPAGCSCRPASQVPWRAPSGDSRPPCILAPHAIASSRGPCREERNRSVQSAELILGLLIAVAALVTIARRLGIAYPIFLVIGGLVLGLVPGIPRIAIEP